MTEHSTGGPPPAERWEPYPPATIPDADRVVDVPLLRKAVEWAEAEARLGVESGWQQWSVAHRTSQTHCGTAFCIAGWALYAGAGMTVEDIRNDPDALERASELLGIPSWNESCRTGEDHLFDGSNELADVRRLAEQYAGEAL